MLQGGDTVVAIDAVALDVAGAGQNGAQELLRYLVLGYCLFVEDEEVIVARGYASLDGEEVAELGLGFIYRNFIGEQIRPFVFGFQLRKVDISDCIGIVDSSAEREFYLLDIRGLAISENNDTRADKGIGKLEIVGLEAVYMEELDKRAS